ncbi:UDP-N-acetylglucosamine 2-epimerase (non-hydrolyzing) [Kineococcus radiotolerans]|uniref:UDP-N-acetylglucosamine 2-epimerase (Non-hydrolyzing) n=1 Tax=Kineococcus radiotolerans TaxID=131568 RepID=A0A7W4XY97_KINRA|nr:UDP-N-acetylglucosamine 2-epimerase (non-hydrolyzing) [Kineococcus radiotolerans]MBB2902926.1 UDP-N-acetylglucosamine 2-epimerase (non-hydrolyzing) [Kineococcus radiotolerans]
MATPTIASSPLPAPERTALRRPLGFPVGEGAPGPVAVVLGTRPEAIKLAEVVRRLGSAGLLVHTGQHYDAALWSDVTAQLGFGTEPVALGVGGSSRGQQLGAAVAALDETFARHRPSCVVVQGDTTAALAGALAANAADLPLVHVEAGLRSFDRRMPEEHNRVLIDHLADLCCAPTATAVAHLRAEGIADERILLTGNTVVESVQHLLPPAAERDRVLAELGLPARYLLLTLHRPENADNPDVLRQVFGELQAVVADGLPVVFPAHPRTLDRMRRDGLGDLVDAFTVIAPQPPAQFLALLERARLVVSDSGGVQEEVSVLKKRLVVVRRSTERPEVMGTFASLVPGGLRLGAAVRAALAEDPQALRDVPSPYGDGSASRVVVESIVKLVAPF